MASRVTDEKREAIAEAIRAGGTCRGIATDFEVSPDTVRRVARDFGLVDAFARTATERATRAKQADNASERARLSARLLSEGHRFLDRLHQPHTAFSFGGKDNTFNSHEFPEPPVDAARQLMTSAAIAIDKHVVLDRHDNDGGAQAALSMMGRIAAAIADAGDEPYVDPHTATPLPGADGADPEGG